MGTGAGIRESVSAKLDADAVECARSRCLDSEGTSLPGRTRMPTIGTVLSCSLFSRFPSASLHPCHCSAHHHAVWFGLDRVPSVGDEAGAEPGD